MDNPKKHRRHQPEFMNNLLDNIFHPNKPICQITPTTTQKKPECFNSFRPDPRTCLDYNISQTDTKLDAGDTKIHVQETVAHYVPNPQPIKPIAPKKKKYFSGGPPQWEFLEEIWMREIEEMQKEFHIQFKIRVAKRKKLERLQMNKRHEGLIKLVGPTWFQELSPKQMATVDNLKKCIVKDLADGTSINTEENIGELGLVLRPNHLLVRKALKNCCSCPVEFLLILYQLINPNRSHYSLNDRLLLSAVVHLTMMDTLMELHIRIPSPPPPPKVKKQKPKRKKHIKYESPYLVPFTFKREPPKFTGVYRNKHVQRPKSPYFCYMQKLQKAKKALNNDPKNSNAASRISITLLDEEIEEEHRLAQTIYENLVDFKPVPLLLKPSKYTPCNNFKKAVVPTPEPVNEETVEEELCDSTPCYFPDVQTRDAETETIDGFAEGCGCSPKNASSCASQKLNYCCEEDKEHENEIIEESCQCCNEAIDRRNEEENDCGCLDQPEESNEAKDEECETEQMCSSNKNLPEHSVSSPRTKCVSEENEVDNETEKKTCKHQVDLEIYNKMHHLIRPSKTERKKCKCKEKHRQFIEKPLCQCERCQEDRRQKNLLHVITGLAETDSTQVTPIIDRVVEGKPCDCLKKYEAQIERYETEKKEAKKQKCTCRKEVEKLISTPVCQCAKCEEDRRRKAAKFVISGIKEDESENIRVIEGVSTGKPCKCAENYEKRVEEYEALQKRKEMMAAFKKIDEKFIIGGVQNTPQGPMYIITGMRPPIDCSCAKKAREEEARKHMEAIMPQVPKGRVKYGIVGVKETPEGNVYILGNAMPTEDCNCMRLYQTFENQHSHCLQLYEDYVAKMKEDCNEFLSEFKQPSNTGTDLNLEDIDVDEKADGDQPEPITEDTSGNVCPELCEDLASTKSVTLEEKVSICDQPVMTCCNEPPENYCSCGNLNQMQCECEQSEVVECFECACEDEGVECVDCTCGPELEEEKVEEEKPLKRYFIFKKIRCNPVWQRNVMIKALKSMADDGFPLAKLPECYKLPHFKLWIQMRCGKFWTQEDRYEYITQSKNLWRHSDSCKIWTDSIPKLAISKSEGHLFDWSRAGYCRKLVSDLLENYYRTVKQNRVNFGREFFPTTFSYEFPFKTWRDCYFAYTPAKEEEVHPKFVWKKFEFKSFADMVRFCE